MLAVTNHNTLPLALKSIGFYNHTILYMKLPEKHDITRKMMTVFYMCRLRVSLINQTAPSGNCMKSPAAFFRAYKDI